MWKKLKGSRITGILIGMLIGGVLVGCEAAVQQAKADGGYLIYEGSDDIGDGAKLITYSHPNLQENIYVIKSPKNSNYVYDVSSAH